MAHTESTITASKGLDVYTQEWRADRPKAAVLLVHGLGEHGGRYKHVAACLNQAGYSLTSFDLPGHGKSSGPRGHIPSYSLVSDLIGRLLAETGARHPGLPLFLYGHSLGGNLVLYDALTCRRSLAGIIATSPGLGTTEPVPAWKTRVGKLLYSLAPAMVMDNGLNVNGLAHDPSVAEKYKADPLVHPKVSARLGLDLLNNGAWIVANAAAFPAVPLLVMQGGSDPIVDPARTRQFAAGVRGDVTYKEWEGLYHELHNEPQQTDVLAYLLAWLDQKSATYGQ